MFFCCYRAKRTMFPVMVLDPALVPAFVPALDPAFVPAPSIAQKRKVSWRLWNWRPVMEKSGTWVLFILAPSSY
jgi:hypothetical protein